ncbi:rhodanese-like domain-containing protein [soil metagenome]
MIPRITVHEVRDRLAAGDKLHFVDVREPEEYAICHIEPSQLLPLGELANRSSELDPPEHALIVVYCHHGVRSITGVAILQLHGFENLASMSGGIDAWSVLIDNSVARY